MTRFAYLVLFLLHNHININIGSKTLF